MKKLTSKKACPKEIDMVGGQAVTEGVLMRDKEKYVIVVRGRKGIVSKTEKLNLTKNKFLKLPIIRGVYSFLNMMVVGINALSWSANQVSGEDEQLTSKDIAIALIGALALSLFLFVGLPFFLTALISKDQGIIFNLIDGLLRVLILILYIYAISLFPDIKRVFQYHGAEHKAVNCYEAGEELTVKNARKHSTKHPRCGTSFLIIVMILSVLIFSLITDPRWYVKLASRIILIPLVMGISYEFLKLSARFRNNIIMRILIQPGLWVQNITTKEPDDKQLEIGLLALKKVLGR